MINAIFVLYVINYRLNMPRSRPNPELVNAMKDWSNAEVKGIFAENFFLDYYVDSLKKQSAALFKKAGKIKKVHPVKPENYLRGTFRIEGELASINVFFTLTPENLPKVQEFSMWESTSK